MEAGQSMEFENQVQKVAELNQDILKKKLAWQRGEIIFSGDNLENDISAILEALEVTMNIQVDESAENTIYLSR